MSEGTLRSVERWGRRRAVGLAKLVLWLALIAVEGGARAQAPPVLRARATLGAAIMTSPDQTGRMGFDTFGGIGQLHLGYALLPWMDAQLGFGAGAFPGPDQATGAAIAPTLGLLASFPQGTTRPFAFVDGGVAMTGALSRPYLHGGVGVDFQITHAFTLGPFLGYGHIFESNDPGFSSDARSVELCATLTFRPVATPPPEHETVFVYERRIVEERRARSPAPPYEPPPHEPSPELLVLLDEALPKARVELLAPVLFKLASDELEPIGVAMLHEVARELKARRNIRLIEVQGYADNRGSEELNADLSARRAQRVLEWLVAHGVESERLRTAARGEHEPIEAIAETEEAHEQNRRVVFRVVETEGP